jgi:hypothetical protein
MEFDKLVTMKEKCYRKGIRNEMKTQLLSCNNYHHALAYRFIVATIMQQLS